MDTERSWASCSLGLRVLILVSALPQLRDEDFDSHAERGRPELILLSRTDSLRMVPRIIDPILEKAAPLAGEDRARFVIERPCLPFELGTVIPPHPTF